MVRSQPRCGLHWVLAIALLATRALAQDSPAAASTPSNYIVATVNDEIITYADVMRPLEAAFAGIDDNSSSALKKQRDKDRLWTEALRNRADEILGLQDAKRLGITASKSEVDRKYRERIAQLGGEVKAQKLAEGGGLTLSEVRQLFQRNITIEKLIGQKIGMGTHADANARQDYDMYVSPAELRRYFQTHRDEFRVLETVKLRWILLPWSSATLNSPVRPLAGGPDRALARTVAMLLDKGADFGAVSKAFSKRNVARYEGCFFLPSGEEDDAVRPVWAPVECARLEPRLRAAALATPVGSHSGPIELKKGIAILRVEERTEAARLSFEEVQPQIQRRISDERYADNHRRIFEDLRRAARLEPPDLFTRVQERKPLTSR